jgi:hypothetical protein
MLSHSTIPLPIMPRGFSTRIMKRRIKVMAMERPELR